MESKINSRFPSSDIREPILSYLFRLLELYPPERCIQLSGQFYRIMVNDEESKTEEKLAEFVGILLGDGCISNTYQNRIQITLNKNELGYSKYVEKLIEEIFYIKPKIRFRKNENALDIQIFDKNLVNFLIEKIGLVASPKWGRAKIPKLFLGNKLEKYVLRGYFDTDGSVVITNNNGTKYPRLEMKVCPSPMRDSFISILKRNGFHFGAYKIDNNRTRIQLNGRIQLKKWLDEIGIMNPNQIGRLDKIDKVI